LGEAGTADAVGLLSRILNGSGQPYFLRSAAAWSLGQIRCDEANAELVAAFSSVDVAVRYEALENLVAAGGPACAVLLGGLQEADNELVAGCAEALRQQRDLPEKVIERLRAEMRAEVPNPWVVWLVGHLPREHFNTAIAELQQRRPDLHYAICLLWSFVESWIAEHWELNPSADLPI